MYEEYWHLKEKPFENTPDPRFFYCSPNHEEALMRLLYVVKERKGAGLLTGEYGSGKTVLTRFFARKLTAEDNGCKIALIVNPSLSAKDFLKEIIFQLEGIECKGSKIKILHTINDILYKNMERGSNVVIIVDEAQVINRAAMLEELRLLLNFQLNDRFLLSLILVGQPELGRKIDEIPQLKQRMAISFHLGVLTHEEAVNYIEHRCRVAGSKRPLFTPDALDLFVEKSNGIPRRLNTYCELALMQGMLKSKEAVDADIAGDVIADMHKEAGPDMKIADIIRLSDKTREVVQIENNAAAKEEQPAHEGIEDIKEFYNRFLNEISLSPPDDIIQNLIMEMINRLVMCDISAINFFAKLNGKEYPGSHSVNVAFLAVKIGIWLNYNKSELKEIALVAMSHNAAGTDEYRRIIYLADVFETMIRPQNNQKPKELHTVVREIIERSSEEFDSEAVKKLVENIGIYPVGTWVRLSNGQIGLVIDLNPEFPLSPKVNILYDKSLRKLPEPRILNLPDEINISIKNPLEEDTRLRLKETIFLK